MPVVLITPEALVGVPGPHVTMLEKAGFEIRYPEDKTFTRGLCGEEETVRVIRGAEALIAGGEFLTQGVINALPDLRVIARLGVGYDRVDIAAATSRSIPVTITPTANHEAVAEHAIALLMAVAKSIVFGDGQARAGLWPRFETEPIRGKTIGILGLGRIGRSTATRAAALGMQVIATELDPDTAFVRDHNIELVGFDDLVARSDYLSIHCPLNEQTENVFAKDVFARMKPGSVLINTARGKIVVEADLIEALNRGPLRGAALDVFEQEPVAADNPLLQMDNVVVTPHLAGCDKFSQRDMGIEAADCIIQLYQGRWPTGAVVNAQLRDGWKWKAAGTHFLQ